MAGNVLVLIFSAVYFVGLDAVAISSGGGDCSAKCQECISDDSGAGWWCVKKCDDKESSASTCKPEEVCLRAVNGSGTWCMESLSSFKSQKEEGNLKKTETVDDNEEEYSPMVIFLDKHMHHVFIALGCMALLCLPPESPVVVLLVYSFCLVSVKLERAFSFCFGRIFKKRRNGTDLLNEQFDDAATMFTGLPIVTSGAKLREAAAVGGTSSDDDICNLCDEPYSTGAEIEVCHANHKPTFLMNCGHRFGFVCIDTHLRHVAEECPRVQKAGNLPAHLRRTRLISLHTYDLSELTGSVFKI